MLDRLRAAPCVVSAEEHASPSSGYRGFDLRMASPAESLIEEFRLQKVRKSLGIQLSGGERRRVEIARCLAADPKYLLLESAFRQQLRCSFPRRLLADVG